MKKIYLFTLALGFMTSCIQAQNVETNQVMTEQDSVVYQKFVDNYKQIEDTIQKIRKDAHDILVANNGELPNEHAEKLTTRWNAASSAMEQLVKNGIENNMQTAVTGEILGLMCEKLKSEELLKYMEQYKGFENTPGYKRAMKVVNAIKLRTPGAMFVDWTAETLDGGKITLSDYIGKGNYVLVDFWASWCGPCRHEMPSVVKAYNEFHAKGFEIIGISLDNNKEAWEKAVTDLHITWPQMSDLKAWACEGAALYGVHSIPATFLYGPDGKLIAANLRGEQLFNTLKEEYSK